MFRYKLIELLRSLEVKIESKSMTESEIVDTLCKIADIIRLLGIVE